MTGVLIFGAIAMVFMTPLLLAFAFYHYVLLKEYHKEASDDEAIDLIKADEALEESHSEEIKLQEENDREVEELSPYEILGISPDASRSEINAAYHKLVRQYHPDVQETRGSRMKELAESKTKILNWAREEALKRC